MKRKWLTGALILMVYWAFGFYPFDFDYPLRNIEQVETDSDGNLDFSRSGIMYLGDTTTQLRRIIDSGSLDVSLEIWTDHLQQSGPARIFTISQDPSFRNITIGQTMDELVIRLRWVGSNTNGTPEFRVGDVFSAPGWHTIRVSVSTSSLRVYVDDRLSIDESFQGDPFTTWASDYTLALGNELTLDRPWLGKIRRAEITVEGQPLNLLGQGILERPGLYYVPGTLHPIHWQPFVASSNTRFYIDWVVNFLGFIPFGILVVMASARQPRTLVLVLYCAALSLSVELGQLLFFHDRNPSVNDLIFNTLGGLAGILIGRRLRIQKSLI